ATAPGALTSTTRQARSLANWVWLQDESACAVSVVWPPYVGPIAGRSRAPAAFEQQELYPRLRSTALAGYAAAGSGGLLRVPHSGQRSGVPRRSYPQPAHNPAARRRRP